MASIGHKPRFDLLRLRPSSDGSRRPYSWSGWFRPSRPPGPRGEKRTPAYVLITVSKITDAEPFRNAIQALTDAATPSAGRLVVDLDKPVAWDGTAAEHVVMIEFESGDQAQAWKSSDAFKSFDAELHRTSNSTMQLVQGLPTPAGRALGGGRRGRGLDQKAFEPNVKEYDLMLNKMHGICKGC
jgi:uncharacterized protein (DUF1330 family)